MTRELRFRKTGLEYIETLLRYIYYSRNKDEWDDLVDLLHQTDEIIEEVAVTTIAEHHFKQGKMAGLREGKIEDKIEGEMEGKISEAQDVLLELPEEQFGTIPESFKERLARIRSYDVLRSLRQQRKICRSLREFEALLESD